jgi:hypothetical protein
MNLTCQTQKSDARLATLLPTNVHVSFFFLRIDISRGWLLSAQFPSGDEAICSGFNIRSELLKCTFSLCHMFCIFIWELCSSSGLRFISADRRVNMKKTCCEDFQFL